MRITLLDFIIIVPLLGLILFIDIYLLCFVLTPLSHHWLGESHAVVDFLIFLLVYGVLSGCILQLLSRLFPIRAGSYTMDQPQYTLWKVLAMMSEAGSWALSPFSVFLLKPLVMKLFGAKVGRNVGLGGIITDPVLAEIEDHAIIGQASILMCHAITNGQIRLAPIKVGYGATVGAHAVLMPGTVIGERAIVTPASVVLSNTTIPAGEVWGGNPAHKIEHAKTEKTEVEWA